jgi:hypothetical protein
MHVRFEFATAVIAKQRSGRNTLATDQTKRRKIDCRNTLLSAFLRACKERGTVPRVPWR